MGAEVRHPGNLASISGRVRGEPREETALPRGPRRVQSARLCSDRAWPIANSLPIGLLKFFGPNHHNAPTLPDLAIREVFKTRQTSGFPLPENCSARRKI